MGQLFYEYLYTPWRMVSALIDHPSFLLSPMHYSYNVCIMAYGQTGSGKTHTMLGSPDKPSRETDYSMLPCAVRELFRYSNISYNQLEMNASSTSLRPWAPKFDALAYTTLKS